MYFRSLVSQAVAKDEVGRIFSINALISAFGGTMVSSAYQKLYNITLETLPGAFLLVAFGLMITTVPLNLLAKKLLKTFSVEDCNEKEDNQEDSTYL